MHTLKTRRTPIADMQSGVVNESLNGKPYRAVKMKRPSGNVLAHARKTLTRPSSHTRLRSVKAFSVESGTLRGRMFSRVDSVFSIELDVPH